MSETPPEPSEKPAPEQPKADPAKPIALTPRQGAASGERVSTPPQDPAALNQQIMSALAQALGGQAATPSPAARDDRGLISREEKRFRRAGATGRADVPAEKSTDYGAAPSSEDAAAESKAEGTAIAETGDTHVRRRFTRENTPAVLRPAAPTFRTMWRQMPGWQRSGIVAVLGAVLFFVGFVLGRGTAPTYVPPSASAREPISTGADNARTPTVWRLAQPAEIKLIDDAMMAQTIGDFVTAEKLLQQLSQDSPDLRGNMTALALLNFQKGDLVGADIYAKRGLDAGEDAGRLYGMRGMVEARLNHPMRANNAFEMATRAEPHQFRPFWLWAEYLRRIGKNQQALERFDQAIARAHEKADEDLMQLHRRLTLIAAGRGGELESAMKQQLAQNPPPNDWLLLAMANAAQKEDFSSAAKFLERATQQMSQDALFDRLNDFYLSQWSYQKELEPYFRPLQSRLSQARRSDPNPTASKAGDDELANPTPPDR